MSLLLLSVILTKYLSYYIDNTIFNFHINIIPFCLYVDKHFFGLYGIFKNKKANLMTNEEYTNIKYHLAKAIKEARLKHQYTIRELAEIADINYSYLSTIENNRIEKPSMYVYLTLFEILEIPITELFSEIENMPPFNRYPPES